jgi:hypothetical protein
MYTDCARLACWRICVRHPASVGHGANPDDNRSPVARFGVQEVSSDRRSQGRYDPGRYSLVLTGSALAIVHRDLIIALAARHRLPAVYYDRYFAAAGGLSSYGSDNVEQCRNGGALRGSKRSGIETPTDTQHP